MELSNPYAAFHSIFRLSELQLGPSSGRIQALDLRFRIRKRSAGNDAPSKAATKTADAATAIKFTRKFPAMRQWNDPVRRSCPGIHVAPELPILPAIKGTHSQSEIMVKEPVTPGRVHGALVVVKPLLREAFADMANYFARR